MKTINKQSFKFLLFLFLLFINQVVILVYDNHIFTFVLFVVITISYWSGGLEFASVLLLYLVLPDKYAQLLGVLCWVIKQRELYRLKKSVILTLFLSYISVTTLANIFLNQGSFLNFFVQIGIYITYLTVIHICVRRNWCQRVQEHITILYWFEVIIVLVQLAYMKSTGDSLTGTLISAHYLGAFFCGYLYFYIKKAKNQPASRRITAITLLSCIFIIYLLDAKHIVGLFILSIGCEYIYNILHVKRKITYTVLLYTALIFSLVSISQNKTIQSFVSENLKEVNAYVYNPKYNKKYTVLLRSLNQLETGNGLIGFGLGQYGSQIALSSGKGVIYPWLDISRKSMAKPYQRTISGVMDERYINKGIIESSMVLGYPLISFLPLIGELGLLGLILFLLILEKLTKNKALILLFFVMTLFDTYFEIPCVFIFLTLFQLLSEESTFDKLRLGIREESYDT